MVDSSRPLSRSTRLHPLPAPPEAAGGATKTASAPTSAIPPPERVKHTTRSHKLEPADNKGQALKPENTVAGRKRTRGDIAAGHDDHVEKPPRAKNNVIAHKHARADPPVTNGTHAREHSKQHNSDAPTARPAAAAEGASSQDKRILRSQDGASRLKSDLSIYFPNYDDIINGVPQEPEFLDVDTLVLIVDEPVKSNTAAAPHTDLPLRNKHCSADKSVGKQASSKHGRKASVNGVAPVHAGFSAPGPLHLNGAQQLDLSSLTRKLSSASSSNAPNADPLPDGVYFKAHRRAERKEKQLRNIEKERAQHEKVQLEGLMEGLQGPDWLKVMGITAITDGEKKDWEGKRTYFVREVDALLDKFKNWREEEKRLKAEKEERRLAEEEDEDEAEDEEGAGVDEEEGEEDEAVSTGPNSSDLDASAREQLLLEARSASSKRPLKSKPAEVKKPPPDVPFTSFFLKPHLRAQALGKQRHGRSELAFGHPLPVLPERDFTLPADFITPGEMRSHARKRRRMKRQVAEAKLEKEKDKV